MVALRDIVSQVFQCLGPLRACEDAVQDRLVYPFEEDCVDPFVDNCYDPVRDWLEVNPLSGIPCLGIEPSLPQYDTPEQQDRRADQVQRTRQHYQYDYNLVRTFKVIEQNGQKIGVQGPGVAVLASLPLEQLPSLCWLLLALQQALVILENLLVILEIISRRPEQENRPMSLLKDEGVAGKDEPDLATVVNDVTPAEAEDYRRQLVDLRDNFLGTLSWGRRAASSVQGHATGYYPLRAPVPAEEQTSLTGSLCGSCSCPRCSPQNWTREIVEDLKDQVSQLASNILQIQALNRHPFSIRAYNDLFQVIPLPEFALTFRNDEMFALQRVAGQNPVVLERIEWDAKWRERFPVTDEQYRKAMGNGAGTLEEAGRDGRLYLCDYEESLSDSIAGNFPPFAGQKYIYAPLALFALEQNDRRVIRPVAIQVGQKPGEENPIFTPGDRWNWEIAKTIVQNSDCNDSEYYRHLGLAHLLTEAFILATYRQLPRKHPLFVLLEPHFQGTLFTNNTAVTSINNEGDILNITEDIFSGTVPSTLGIAANSVHRVNFTFNMLRYDLKKRRVDDPRLLPNYPYRDDAMLIWNAIHRWSANYVSLYYCDDRDVIGDYELQNWVWEVSSEHGGRIKGVGEDGKGGSIETVEYLIDCIAQVIYTASAHHALTNFPLDDYEIYSPGWPGALYQPAPTSTKPSRRRDWLAYLAPLSIAILQQALGRLVGSTYFTQLGRYPICHFDDPRVRGPLMEFQDELREVECIIRDRNATRLLPYPYLLPSRIPASTNI